MAEFYRILGDKTRIRIIALLFDDEELCVKDIYTLLGTDTSLASHQLRVLKVANIVKSRREGKKVFYSLDDEHVKQIFETAFDHIKHL